MTKTIHTALYRAYRPQSFKDVLGQDHVINVLQAAIDGGKVGHAYLFSGGRGTGKTSVARIFAKEIGVIEKDLYEIDAASNRGIDDIRELREGVHVMPFSSPYKLYIIDEAHMLTKEAWNALLKTLEEPPSHAIFILATTERHKVPDTIQSRCELYTFKQPSRELLAETVSDIAKKEKYTLEQSAADLIALLAEGSFRDALGILQKVITISKNKKIEIKEVEAVTGAPSATLVRALVEALAEKDTEKAVRSISEAVKENMDIRVLTKLVMHRVRAVLLLRYVPEMKKDIAEELSGEDIKMAESLAKDKEMAISSDTLKALLDAYAMMAYAAIPHLPLELAIIDITHKT